MHHKQGLSPEWNLQSKGVLQRDDRLTAKQAVFPGMTNWIWPDTAFSLTPDSIQGWFNSLQAWWKSKKLNELCMFYQNHYNNWENFCSIIGWELLMVNQNTKHKHAWGNLQYTMHFNFQEKEKTRIIYLLYLLPFLLQSYPHNLTPGQLLFHLFHHG